MYREKDNRVLFGENIIIKERIYFEIKEFCEIYFVIDDIVFVYFSF